eukprot:COSAG02_NODE_1772_length_10984_cov_8.166651_6_plen_237_part_00
MHKLGILQCVCQQYNGKFWNRTAERTREEAVELENRRLRAWQNAELPVSIVNAQGYTIHWDSARNPEWLWTGLVYISDNSTIGGDLKVLDQGTPNGAITGGDFDAGCMVDSCCSVLAQRTCTVRRLCFMVIAEACILLFLCHGSVESRLGSPTGPSIGQEQFGMSGLNSDIHRLTLWIRSAYHQVCNTPTNSFARAFSIYERHNLVWHESHVLLICRSVLCETLLLVANCTVYKKD